MTGFRRAAAHQTGEGDGICFSATPAGVRQGRAPADSAAWVEVHDSGHYATPVPALAEAAPPRTLWFNAAMLALLLRGGLLVHTAGVELNGHGLLLAGVSGIGKSTLAAILEAAFPACVLGDERIAVRPVDKRGWTLAGTPWSSTAGLARRRSAPLAALVFLEQAPVDALRPLPAAEALPRLLPLVSVDWALPALADRGAGAMDALLASVPAFVFRFAKSPAAAQFLSTWAETLVCR